MRTLVELEHRHAVFEMMARHQAGGFELRQHAIDGGESDVLARAEQPLVDLFGRHVARGAALENLEDLQPRQRDLEPGLARSLPSIRCSLDAGMIVTHANYHIGRWPLPRYRLQSACCVRWQSACVYRMPDPAGQLPGSTAAGRQVKTGMTRSPGALPARHTDGAGRIRQRALGLRLLPEDAHMRLQTPRGAAHVPYTSSNNLVRQRVDSDVDQTLQTPDR